MALFASSVVGGTAGLLAAMVLLYTGINVQRSPFQALGTGEADTGSKSATA